MLKLTHDDPAPPTPPHNSAEDSLADPRASRRLDPDLAADLRRRRRTDIAETLVLRADLLPRDERELVRAVYADGRPVASLAPIAGVPPRAMRRRLRRVVRRLTSPEFLFVARNSRAWSPTMRRVAVACFLEGRSLRDAAHRLGLTLHVVRSHRDAVLALATTGEAGR